MEINFAPEVESSILEMAELSGRAPGEVVNDLLAGYLAERSAATRATLDSRYDDLASGRVKPVNAEAFFESLRLREEELLGQRNE